jgi:hypothetical protein
MFYFTISIAGDAGWLECEFTLTRTAHPVDMWQSEDGRIKIFFGLFGWTAYDDQGKALTWLGYRTPELAALDAVQRGWE